MIFGHEGLPRSGKSAEAMKHVCDSLLADRKVITNISGINHKAIADYLGIPLPTVTRLLVCIEPPEDVAEDEERVVPWVKSEFLRLAENDSLIIWDEINQFWPPDRQPLPAAWAKFVTEHGHKGIDILIMGQDMTELHQTWRKRLQRYTRFTKLDMIGKEDMYHWASFTSTGRLKFKRMSEGKRPYNKDYFGFYKSHEDDTENKGNYKDGRFSLFQRKHKVAAVAMGVLCIFCVYLLTSFFRVPADDAESPAVVEHQPASLPAAAPAPPPRVPQAAPASDPAPPKREPIDYLDRYADRYQIRLSGFVQRSKPVVGLPLYDFQIDFHDENYRVRERMNRADVVSLGWQIEVHDYGLKIMKGDRFHIVRPWPVDLPGRVSRAQLAAISPTP